MIFQKYQSVKRERKWREHELEDFLSGHIHVFPKLDGANASIWMTLSGMACGSRNNELELGSGLQGFGEYCKGNSVRLSSFLDTLDGMAMGGITVYGEWLVPHAIKGYTENMWRRFWVFDVMITETQDDGTQLKYYMPYEDYAPICIQHEVDYIPRIGEFPEGTTVSALQDLVESNHFGMFEKGVGEGIVVKNYESPSDHWMKMIHADFAGAKGMRTKIRAIYDGTSPEEAIAMKHCTPDLIEKEYQKIINGQADIQRGQLIARLLGQVWYSFVEDEMWNILKKNKHLTLDFDRLNRCVTQIVKTVKEELF